MTIVNMVGGGGDELITETIQGDYYIQGTASTKSNISSTSAITYINTSGKIYVAYDEDHLLMGFEYVGGSNMSNLNFRVYSYYTSLTADTLGDYIRSKCPEGKTISGTIYGISGMLEESGTYFGDNDSVELSVSGDRSAIQYSGLPSGKNYATYNIYTRGARIYPITVSVVFT